MVVHVKETKIERAREQSVGGDLAFSSVFFVIAF